MPRLGVDLGGTKIEAVLIGDEGQILGRERVATPKGNYDATLSAIALAIDSVAAPPDLPLGIGTPGSIGPATGLIRNSNSTVLNGTRLDQDLRERLHRNVRIANDADCFALAEARAGAGRGAATVFGAILGTGVGGGIVIDGKLLGGPNRLAGEWGHNPLRNDAAAGPLPPCYCGQLGCVEAWCSGPAVEAAFRERTGEALSVQDIAARRLGGCAVAAEIIDTHTSRLAAALAVVVNIIDPEVIVLGGGLSHLDHLYTDLPLRMMPHVFSDVFVTPVVKNELGDSAGVIGAAWLWP
ncbi:MAG: ROK family protein [Pseudomonadota bacterium]